MTIVVSVQCSEGIVLAADSAIAIISEGKPVRVWPHAKKVSHIADYNIGVLSFGLGALGERNIQSLMYEFEVAGKALPENGINWSVEAIANSLHSFLSEKYNAIYGDAKSPDRTLGMIVAGYSRGSFEPEQYRVRLPYDVSPIRIPFGPSRVGVVFDGLPDAIYRLLYGMDLKLALALSRITLTEQQSQQLADALLSMRHPEEVVAEFVSTVGGEADEFDKFLAWRALASYDLVMEGMPLQDGIDLASWLIETTIGRYRFAEEWPLAGGAIDVAVVTHSTYTWIQRKSWHGYDRRPVHFPEGGAV